MTILNIYLLSLQTVLYVLFVESLALPRTGELFARKFLEIPISKRYNGFKKSSQKRSGLEISLKYEQDLFYAATLQIGTPIEEITVIFDTGSSDTWVMSSENPYCLGKDGAIPRHNTTYHGNLVHPSIDCQQWGTYIANTSSSCEKLNIGRFYTNYSDGSFADGYWGKEKLLLNGYDISNLQFGVAEIASIPAGGVLGIGFQSLESVRGYDNAPGTFYPNFPQVLKNEGYINTVAYSLYLNSDQSSIMFGAIDTAKFLGDMYTFPIVNQYPSITEKPATLAISLQGVGAQSVDKCKQSTFTTMKTPALLDSGSNLISAPQEILENMANFLNASYSEEDQIYILECPSDDDDTEFLFDFGDLKIKVPLSDLILLPPQNGYCGFAVLPEEDSFILGQAFLSSAYVVYDLEHYVISLAQSNRDSNPSGASIQDISSDGKVPGAKKASAVPWPLSDSFKSSSGLFHGTSMNCKSNLSSTASTYIPYNNTFLSSPQNSNVSAGKSNITNNTLNDLDGNLSKTSDLWSSAVTSSLIYDKSQLSTVTKSMPYPEGRFQTLLTLRSSISTTLTYHSSLGTESATTTNSHTKQQPSTSIEQAIKSISSNGSVGSYISISDEIQSNNGRTEKVITSNFNSPTLLVTVTEVSYSTVTISEEICKG